MNQERKKEESLEDKCITLELVDTLSRLVLEKLEIWAKNEIFKGDLTVETILKESANAGAVSYRDQPDKAKIVINMGMLFEIYRDSLAFPIYSEALKRSTNTYNDEVWQAFSDVKIKFDHGYPDVQYSKLTEIGKLLVASWHQADEEHSKHDVEQEKMDVLARSITCRFQMFEFMIAWVFFHELAHLIQRHYTLKNDSNNIVEIYEVNENNNQYNSSSHSLEILADIEGVDLTLRYMKKESVYNYESFYFMLCAQVCMFNRFHKGRAEEGVYNFNSSHPHPVVRLEYITTFFTVKMDMDLPLSLNMDSRKEKALESIYITTKSSIVANLFWANRHSEYRGGDLTEFMKIQMTTNTYSSKVYNKFVLSNIKLNLKRILLNHRLEDSVLFLLDETDYFDRHYFIR